MSTSAIIHAVAGGVGSSIAFGLLYPLDQIRTLLQVDDLLAEKISVSTDHKVLTSISLITEKYGGTALWRGIAPVLLTMGISNCLYFYFSFSLKELVLYNRSSNQKDHLGFLENMTVSSLAGIMNVLLTTPLWVANTRIKTCPKPDKSNSSPDFTSSEGTQEKKQTGIPSLLGTLLGVYREEGVRGLWSGTVPSLLLVSNPIIQFVAYDYLKRVIIKSKKASNQRLHSYEAFLIGAIAKTLATIITYPLQLAQVRMRAHSGTKIDEPSGLLQCCTGTATCLGEIFRTRGLKGLYQGMRAKLIHTVLNASIMFASYEKILQLTVEALGGTGSSESMR